MFPNDIGLSRSTATRPPEVDTKRPVATLEHRTNVHAVTRADCAECLPAPCILCGQVLCPDAVAHRLEVVSSERYWIEVA